MKRMMTSALMTSMLLNCSVLNGYRLVFLFIINMINLKVQLFKIQMKEKQIL